MSENNNVIPMKEKAENKARKGKLTEKEAEGLNDFIKETTNEVNKIVSTLNIKDTLLVESTLEIFISTKMELVAERKIKGINKTALKKLFNETLKSRKKIEKARDAAIKKRLKAEDKERKRLEKLKADPELKKVNVQWYATETNTTTGDQAPIKVWQNLDALLEAYGIDVRQNLITREIEYITSNEEMKHLETLGDNARLEDIRSLAALQKYTVSYDMLNMQLLTIASSKQYNPVANYLLENAKKWDGKDRIKDLCDTITPTEDFDNELKEILIKKWLMNCARQALNKDSTKGAFGVLVLQGAQALGKSWWIQTIIPNKDWLKTGSHLDISSKDNIMENTKYWIVELGELDASMKNEQSKMKAFITRESDEFRKPYEKLSEKHPRYTVFYASVNPKQFLKDETGNRRYWTIPCQHINNKHNIDLDQMWGQVMKLAIQATSINDFTLSDEELNRLNASNRDFTVADDIDIYLEEIYDFTTPSESWIKFVSANALLTALKLKDSKISSRVIKNALNRKGIEQVQSRVNGIKSRGYYMPEFHSVEGINPFTEKQEIINNLVNELEKK